MTSAIPSVEEAIAILGLKITPEKFIAVFRIEGPALISFSGGRTSALMLWCILVAHGGVMPDGVIIAFANTGKEREETLRFVHECGVRWNVLILWVEFRAWSGRATPIEDRFEIVGFNSASRNGEPFEAVIEVKQFLPNAVTRFCTTKMKVEAMKHLMLSLGHDHWLNAVGLRADEGLRVMKQLARNAEGRERWTSIMPLSKVGVTKRHVWSFWLGLNADPKRLTHPLPQGFDLGLYPYEGNCDDCFLKGRDVLIHQERERPGTAEWWAEQERKVTGKTRKPDGARFVTEFSYQRIPEDAKSPLLIPLDWREVEYDGECSLYCSGEAA